MQHLICWISLLILPTALCAQSQSVDRFFDLYGDNPNYNVVNLQGSILALMSQDSDYEGEVELNRLRILCAPHGQGSLNAAGIRSLDRRLKSEAYEVLADMYENGGHITFLMAEKRGIIQELVMLVQGKEQFTVVSLQGKIPLDRVQNLDIDLDVDGWNQLKGSY